MSNNDLRLADPISRGGSKHKSSVTFPVRRPGYWGSETGFPTSLFLFPYVVSGIWLLNWRKKCLMALKGIFSTSAAGRFTSRKAA